MNDTPEIRDNWQKLADRAIGDQVVSLRRLWKLLNSQAELLRDIQEQLEIQLDLNDALLQRIARLEARLEALEDVPY